MMEDKINIIVNFSSNILTDEKVGSRYEGHDITKLWQLGDKILNSYNPLNISILLPMLQKAHELNNIRYDDRLYRASIIFRKYWDKEEEYKKAIKKINVWTKLRELYPVCKGIIENKTQVTRQEVDALIDKCNNLTYVQVREVFKKFRQKYDTILSDLGVDECDFSDLLIKLSEELRGIIEKEDKKSELLLRQKFNESFRNFRLLLSALQKEEVYQKWNSEIKKIVKQKIPVGETKIEMDIGDLFTQLNKFITHDTARKKIRQEIPITFIGNLSTFLRAVESDVNKAQFQKNRDILQKFIGKLSS